MTDNPEYVANNSTASTDVVSGPYVIPTPHGKLTDSGGIGIFECKITPIYSWTDTVQMLHNLGWHVITVHSKGDKITALIATALIAPEQKEDFEC